MWLKKGHDPYFSGNSFATQKEYENLQELERHNPYFSGNSFATTVPKSNKVSIRSHNPYFSGNSFATKLISQYIKVIPRSQSLF